MVPTTLKKLFVRNYRGLSTALTLELLGQAGLDPSLNSADLSPIEWQALFTAWQRWLMNLESHQFSPRLTAQGYSVLKPADPDLDPSLAPSQSLQTIFQSYYSGGLMEQQFKQLHHQLQQRLKAILGKLYTKRDGFLERLKESDRASDIRTQADLLMAHLTEWTPGLSELIVTDFETGNQVAIPLAPDRNAVQNAQARYKQHQKFKRSRAAVTPLLDEIQAEIAYLQQVETALQQLEPESISQREALDLEAIEDIRDELIQQGYLATPAYRSDNPKVPLRADLASSKARPANKRKSNSKSSGKSKAEPATTSQPRCYSTPSGYELLIGRNNRQNDILTFRTAGDYDLWFHSQEIPGSHALLRLPAGSVPDEADLQSVADLAAYYSQARESDRVPVVYTQPKHVYKPKGAKPGMAIYKQETVIWGNPRSAFVLSVTSS